MTDPVLLVLLGMALLLALWAAEKWTYRKTLVLIARAGTPEKLADGKFYYIVPESEYVELKIRAFRSDHAQS